MVGTHKSETRAATRGLTGRSPRCKARLGTGKSAKVQESRRDSRMATSGQTAHGHSEVATALEPMGARHNVPSADKWPMTMRTFPVVRSHSISRPSLVLPIRSKLADLPEPLGPP